MLDLHHIFAHGVHPPVVMIAQVSPFAFDNVGWKYYIVYCVILSLQVVFIYFLFPETANRSLEQLASRKYINIRLN